MEILKPFRKKIDEIDDRMIDLLAERMAVIRDVADVKARENIPAILPDRVAEVINRVCARAAAKDIDPVPVRRIYEVIVDYSCGLEDEIMNAPARKKSSSGF